MFCVLNDFLDYCSIVASALMYLGFGFQNLKTSN